MSEGYESLSASGGEEDHTPDSYQSSILDAASTHHADGKYSNTKSGNEHIRNRSSYGAIGSATSANRASGGAGDFSMGY